MTDDATGSDPTSQPGRSWRIPALVAGLVIVIVVAVAVAVGRGDDDEDGTDASSDPTTTSATSTAASPTGSGSPSASDSSSVSASPTNGDPTPSPVINKAARAAIHDDFPALVPSGVPAGWTVVSAAYDAASETWRVDLTDLSGAPVQLSQSKDSVDDLVSQWLGPDAQPGGKVDLSDFGTGRWQSYTATAGAGIAKKLSGTSALVFGADRDSVIELAQELLTAEDSGSSDDGG